MLARSALAVPAITFAALAAVPSGSAASVLQTTEYECYSSDELETCMRVEYSGGPEANTVNLRRVGDDQVQVTDQGAVIATGDRCQAQGSTSATCTLQGPVTFAVSLGDGTDSLTIAGSLDCEPLRPSSDCPRGTKWALPYIGVRAPIQVDGGEGHDDLRAGIDDIELNGGAGDDDLRGAEKPWRIGGGDLLIGGDGDDSLSDDRGGDRLDGGPGRDTLRSGRADDRLDGGAGPDRLHGGQGGDALDGGSDRDTLDGGTNGGRSYGRQVDVVSYADRAQPVVVDLSDPARGQGEAREGDLVRRIEDAKGGDGADVLLGDGARNTFKGGDGDDRIAGRHGNDRLWPGPGRDAIEGGRGRDFFRIVQDGMPDGFACGPGDDFVDGWRTSGVFVHSDYGTVDSVDLLRRDCEWVSADEGEDNGFRLLAQPVVPNSYTLRFANPCTTGISRLALRAYTPELPEDSYCRHGEVTASSGGDVIGTTRFRRKGEIRMRLRRSLAMGRLTRLSVVWTTEDRPHHIDHARATYALEVRPER
jgi:Ca2+-binding RTX toxin-like protein